MSSRPRRKFYLSPFPFSFERTQTKTNNCTTSYLPTLAIHFVCQDFPFPSTLQSYYTILFRTTIVDRSNYRSDQIEQQDILHCLSTFTGVGISTRYFCLNYHQLPPQFPISIKPSATATAPTTIPIFNEH